MAKSVPQNENKNKRDQTEISELFEKYIDVCNQLLDQNKAIYSQFQLMRLQNSPDLKHPFEVAIFEDRPRGAYSLLYQDSHLALTQNEFDPLKAWRLDLSHIEEVAANPDKYLNDPDQLDFTWFKCRFER